MTEVTEKSDVNQKENHIKTAKSFLSGLRKVERREFEEELKTWTDVKELLDEDQKHLVLGEMVMGERISLSDAMNSLTIKDPKYDYYSKEGGSDLEGLLDSIEISEVIELTDVITAMNSILRRVASWMLGNPTAANLASCILLQRPSSVEENSRFLGVFIGYTLRMLAYMRISVFRTSVAVQEDIHTNMCGIDAASPHRLSDNFSKYSSLSSLSKTVEKQCVKMVNGGEARGTQILHRLQLVKAIQRAYFFLTEEMVRDERMAKAVEFCEIGMNACEEILKEDLSNSNKDFGINEKIGPKTVPQMSPGCGMDLSFDFKDSILVLYWHLYNLRELRKFSRRFSSITPVIDLVEEYTQSDRPSMLKIPTGMKMEKPMKPDILCNCVLMVICTTKNRISGNAEIVDLIRREFSVLGVAEELLDTERGIILRLRELILKLLVIYCSRFSRHRQTLASFFDYVEVARSQMGSIDLWIGHWLGGLAIRGMLNYVSVGFPLGIYADEEIIMAMKYAEEIYGKLRSILLNQVGFEEGKRRRSIIKKERDVIENQLATKNKLILIYDCTQMILSSTIGILNLLSRRFFRTRPEKMVENDASSQQEGSKEHSYEPIICLDPFKEYPFGEPHVKFKHRFMDFWRIQDLTPYFWDDFEEYMTGLERMSIENRTEYIRKNLQAARNSLLSVPDGKKDKIVQGLLKVCVGNIVALTPLEKAEKIQADVNQLPVDKIGDKSPEPAKEQEQVREIGLIQDRVARISYDFHFMIPVVRWQREG